MNAAGEVTDIGGRNPADVAAGIIQAINARDSKGLIELLDAESEVATGRSTHAGPEAIVAWAGKEYDHLTRRYAIDELRVIGRAVLALGAVQYVWRGGEEVADTTPVALELDVAGGRLRSLRIRDDVAAALAAFESKA